MNNRYPTRNIPQKGLPVSPQTPANPQQCGTCQKIRAQFSAWKNRFIKKI